MKKTTTTPTIPISERLLPPSPAEVRSARERAGLTQAQAAGLVSPAKTKPYRTWAGYEIEDIESVNARAIPLATWELFLLLTDQHPTMKLSDKKQP